ncbi:YscQ/HrcQ family type III secretion apparatus protein [Plesiomonas sp.]|uniref:YscQ/HrcQ family type III secretion apparatus protein n=1 Tax=Plesiomonas sp. TaxID=2486279 RepID=UPI003F365099
MLKLRRIDSRQRALANAAKRWRARGHDVELVTPRREGIWVSVTASEARWSGWMQPINWLAQVAPQWAGLASSVRMDQLAAQWMAATEQPLTLPLAELTTSRLQVGMPVSGESLPSHPLLRLVTAEGPLWLEQVPTFGQDRLAFPTVRWPLRWVIGESLTRAQTLHSVCSGDVLLIGGQLAEVRCHQMRLAQFHTYKEGLMMTLDEEQEFADQEYVDQDEVALPIQNLRQLPVRLEFVLHQRMLSLDELQTLAAGGLLQLPADAEQRVEVRANGVLLGRGELVQMEGALGVEIIEWLGGITDVE